MLREGAGAAKFVAIDGYPNEQWEEVARESAKLASIAARSSK